MSGLVGSSVSELRRQARSAGRTPTVRKTPEPIFLRGTPWRIGGKCLGLPTISVGQWTFYRRYGRACRQYLDAYGEGTYSVRSTRESRFHAKREVQHALRRHRFYRNRYGRPDTPAAAHKPIRACHTFIQRQIYSRRRCPDGHLPSSHRATQVLGPLWHALDHAIWLDLSGIELQWGHDLVG